jgi:hypothetical protein
MPGFSIRDAPLADDLGQAQREWAPFPAFPRMRDA